MEASKELNVKYKFDEHYNPNYINGAIGGVNAIGEIVVNFYLERAAIPRQQIFEVSDRGQLGQVLQSIPSDLEYSTLRYVENGIIMTAATAKNIHKWLGEQIAYYDDLIKQQSQQGKRED